VLTIPAQRPLSAEEEAVAAQRRREVRDEFAFAWSKYRQLCFGLTIVDALDTMWIMGLSDEFREATEWVRTSLNLDLDKNVQFFETVIRVLGGLLSAYELSGERVFLDRAKELADRMAPTFRTPKGLPDAYVNLHSGHHEPPGFTGGNLILAEVGTFQMEYYALSRYLGDPSYEEAARRALGVVKAASKSGEGLFPTYISLDGQFRNAQVTWGGMGDSFYEYLLKVCLATAAPIRLAWFAASLTHCAARS
jgi:mannosyl-oligosaccharide alpha-1,2-mannosidase